MSASVSKENVLHRGGGRFVRLDEDYILYRRTSGRLGRSRLLGFGSVLVWCGISRFKRY